MLLEGNTTWRLDTVSEDIEKRGEGNPKCVSGCSASYITSPKANMVTERAAK